MNKIGEIKLLANTYYTEAVEKSKSNETKIETVQSKILRSIIKIVLKSCSFDRKWCIEIVKIIQ